MKKFLSFLLSTILLAMFAIPCFAANSEPILVSETHELLENGVECTTCIYEEPSFLRSTSKGGIVSQEYTYGGKVVAYVRLNATFTYDGRMATATGASGSHSTASGWSYAGQSTWCSGATAHLTATVSGSVTIPVNLSLTCSPTGTLS